MTDSSLKCNANEAVIVCNKCEFYRHFTRGMNHRNVAVGKHWIHVDQVFLVQCKNISIQINIKPMARSLSLSANVKPSQQMSIKFILYGNLPLQARTCLDIECQSWHVLENGRPKHPNTCHMQFQEQSWQVANWVPPACARSNAAICRAAVAPS